MRRGTTPTQTFKSPIDLTDAVVVEFTYRQDGKNIITKTKQDMEITDEEVRIRLEQIDTLAFSTIGQVEIQCRAKFADGTAVASNIIKVPVCKILKEGVI